MFDGPAAVEYTMAYDTENRLIRHRTDIVGGPSGFPTTYTYDGDGLKRSERINDHGLKITTLIWDGVKYLGEQS